MDEMFVRLTASRRRQRRVEDAVACGLALNESLATAMNRQRLIVVLCVVRRAKPRMENDVQGPSAEITQAMVRHDGALYKLMAVTVGGNPDAASMNRFIDSLSIVQPATQPQSKSVQDIGGGVDLHNLSKTIGSLGALLAIGLLVYLLTRGKKTGSSTNQVRE